MNPILCSTGCLIGRPNGRNIRLLESCIDRLECDGFEFMLYSDWYERLSEITAYLKSLPTTFPTMHCEKHIGEALSSGLPEDREEAFRRFLLNCELAEALGSERLVLHLWDGLASDSHIERNLEAYGRLRETAGEHGLELTVENVVCNRRDPWAHWLELLERYPDVSFTFDTKMAAFHEQLELLYRPENAWVGRHVHHLHVNDYGGGYKDWANLKTLHIGRGKLDFAPFFAWMRQEHYNGYLTVEATSFGADGSIDFESLNRSIRTIRGYMEGER